MPSLEPIPYSDAKLRSILQRVKTIALVGASPNWNRPSYFVMKYLQSKGYRVIPVNPGIAGKPLLGEMAYASLRDIPEPVDMVDVFRASDEVPPIVDDAIAIGAKVLWMQLGVRNDEAAKKAEAAGTRGRHEPLPEDRVRATGRRALLERRQFRHHPQPPAPGADGKAGEGAQAATGQSEHSASRPAPSMRGRRPIPSPARARRRSIRRHPMSSRMSTTPPRSSTCIISATSIRA